jgi:SAM-dependent methyltransferase
MNNNIIPTAWFVCPINKQEMHQEGDFLISKAGKYQFDTSDCYWNFMPNKTALAQDKWHTWEKLQENGVASYISSPQNNLGVGKRQDFLQFADFCQFKGNILDIGVGPQKCPTHIAYNTNPNVFFIGIDPLVGEQPRDFAFVQGLGEYLPFQANLFDQVLYVTSLDHFIDPVITLIEAKRIIKPEGDICVWIGEKDKNAPKPAISPEWYQKLQVPEGAEDPFHFKRFSIQEFEGYIAKAGLQIKENVIHVVDEWRKNCFYKLIKI